MNYAEALLIYSGRICSPIYVADLNNNGPFMQVNPVSAVCIGKGEYDRCVSIQKHCMTETLLLFLSLLALDFLFLLNEIYVQETA